MNNLIFCALILALLYCFFIYLPQQKKNISSSLFPKPLTHNKPTQTDPDPLDPTLTAELELERKKRQELELMEKDYQQKIENQQNQLTSLQTQVRELVKRPTNSKGTQTDSDKDLEKTLDTLIKNIQELNNSLES